MISRLAFLVVITSLLFGCKIEINVPEGGDVVSISDAYACQSGDTCIVEVNDFEFDEKFKARPWEGWVFIGWKVGPSYLCRHGACRLSTKGFERYENLSSIVESDGTFYLEPVFVKATPFDEALANIQDQDFRSCLEAISAPRQYAEQVMEIHCSNYWKLASLQGIEAFVGLRRLSLATDGSLRDLQPLGKLTRLQSLDLQLGSDYFNAAALGDLKLLNHLKLNMNTPWRGDRLDLTEMSYLQTLRKLELVDVNKDLNQISSLVNLRELVIDPINWRSRINDLRPFARLTNLESLKIKPQHASEISDINPIAGLKKLKTLDLSYNQIGDISPLTGLTNLESLALSSNEISDINPIAGLTKLESLFLSSNEISDISPLAEFDRISVLDLADNLVRNVVALNELYPVTRDRDFVIYIDLSENPIRSIGNALDGIRTGWVWLIGVSLSCEEYSQLAEQYVSRVIVASLDASLIPLSFRTMVANPDNFGSPSAAFKDFFYPPSC